MLNQCHLSTDESRSVAYIILLSTLLFGHIKMLIVDHFSHLSECRTLHFLSSTHISEEHRMMATFLLPVLAHPLADFGGLAGVSLP